MSDLLDPSAKAKKAAVERHHLFPRSYLQRMGIGENRLINQVADYTLVEWNDNIAISDRSPRDYVPELETRFGPDELRQMYACHALPDGWHEMGYATFLEERRKRIAQVIRSGFEELKEEAQTSLPQCDLQENDELRRGDK